MHYSCPMNRVRGVGINFFFFLKAKNTDAMTFSSVSKPTLRQQGKRPKMKEKIKPKIEATLNVIMAMVWCYG